MEEGGLDAVFMSIFTSQKERTEEGHSQAKEKAILMIELTKKMIAENNNQVEFGVDSRRCLSPRKTGKTSHLYGDGKWLSSRKKSGKCEFF